MASLTKKELIEKSLSKGIALSGEEKVKDLKELERRLFENGKQIQKDNNEDIIKPFPFYDEATVIEVLDNEAVNGFRHCRMSDGCTKHIPAELF